MVKLTRIVCGSFQIESVWWTRSTSDRFAPKSVVQPGEFAGRISGM